MFNIPALMEYVARHLHTIVRQYTSSGELLEPTDLPKVSSDPDHVAYITISGPDNTCFLDCF